MKRVSLCVNDYLQIQGINSVVDLFMNNRDAFLKYGIFVLGVYDDKTYYTKIPKREQKFERKTASKKLKAVVKNSFIGQAMAIMVNYILKGYNSYRSVKKNHEEDVLIFQDVFAARFYIKRNHKTKILYMTHMYQDEMEQIFLNYPKLKKTVIESYLRKIYSYVYLNADSIITICDTTKRVLLKRYSDVNVFTIYNSINEIAIGVTPGGHEKINIVMATSVTKRKGMDLFIEALLKMDSNKRDCCEFHIYGEGDYFDTLKEICIQHGCKNVHLYGQKVKPYLKYGNMDILLLTSRNETLPMSILEAMSIGLPIVATDVGGVNELIANDENGFLINPTVEAIKTGLERIVDSKKKLAEWGMQSKKRYNNLFGVDKWVKSFAECINKA